jgi:hypothetical protein
MHHLFQVGRSNAVQQSQGLVVVLRHEFIDAGFFCPFKMDRRVVVLQGTHHLLEYCG